MESGSKKPTHKPHFCIFCKEVIKRIHEHFLRKHRDNERIKSILLIEDKNKRYWEWKKLTQEGDFYFNKKITNVMEEKKIVKIPNTVSSRKKYFDCPRCKGRLRTCSRAQHEKTCKARFKKEVGSDDGKENEPLENVPELLLNKVRQSQYLTKFLIGSVEEKKSKATVRTMITDLMGLQEGLQKVTGLKNKPLVTFLSPNYVDDFIKVIKEISEEISKKKEKLFLYPHRARRLCRVVNSLVKFLNIYYIKRDLNDDAENCSKFRKIFEAETSKFIKKQAYRSIKLKKLENPTELPQTSDITFLTEKLEKELPELLEKLRDEKTPKSWRNLAENILCQLTIFNRRRGGAVEKLTVEQYLRTENPINCTTEEALYNLNKDDEEFLKNIRIIKIIHKCDNVVPIFIQKTVDDAMKILLEFREFGDVNPKNEYFFAASRKSLNPIRCIKVMEKYRTLLPEDKRKIFTATALRKHGATTAQVLNMSQDDTEEWASHMGHTVKVHKDYYRCEQQINSILKTGRILTALKSGKLKYYKGKRVEEINFEDSPKEKSPCTLDSASTSKVIQNEIFSARKALFQDISDSSENDNLLGVKNYKHTGQDISDSDSDDIAGIPRLAVPITLPKTVKKFRPRISSTPKGKCYKRKYR